MGNIHKKKYQQVILYLCEKLGGEVRGKKKLAKLLYFVDFDFYEKKQKSITGDTYDALPMGPVPRYMSKITEEMAKKRLLDIKSVEERDGYNPTEVYRCIATPHSSLLKKEEKEVLDRVIAKYGNLSGKDLENLTHAEAPYVGTEANKEIAYELAFYRGTDFTDI